MLKFGKKLRELRQEKGYSQEYLAYELGMSQGNYSKLESDSHFPSVNILEKVAKLYETTLQDMQASEGQPQTRISPESLQAVTTFSISQSTQNLVDDLLSSKDKIITLQAKQIEMLVNQLEELKRRSCNGL